jgi:hypothetical protein
MPESDYLRRETENHPDEPEYLNDLRILRRFVQKGSVGYRQSDDVIFRTLKARYPEAYSAFGRERKRDVLEANAHSPYLEEQRRTYPDNPNKDGYLEALQRLRNVMILSKLGYGSREMAMLEVNSRRRYPEAYDAFEGELEDL